MNNTILWYATRGAGVVSLILFTAVVVLGVIAAMRWQTPSWPRFLTTGFHRNLALTSLVFLAIHIVTAVVDPFTALGWNAALIPFSSSYRTFWLGLGVVALYLLLAIVVTSLLRPLFGYRTWRVVHWLTYAMWPIAVIHGIGTGSDTRFSWMLALDGVCIIAVVMAILWRTSRRSPTSWRELAPGRQASRSAAQ
ncbi:MAG TPA: ferric reductase-like transmembrane domain-containing protein [Candidatus Dormibacteraeota bacterium]|jgi:sulfoxide reductase heme-binding subunit YedZ|nr:ferric reductase-like transmembrane domain-containing protein [Candidatus Dormibacteraeota bacterium]